MGFFADDTRILKHIHTKQDASALQQDLDNVIVWARQNKMALHEDSLNSLLIMETLKTLYTNYPLRAGH
jgi:hypothetical protein